MNLKFYTASLSDDKPSNTTECFVQKAINGRIEKKHAIALKHSLNV